MVFRIIPVFVLGLNISIFGWAGTNDCEDELAVAGYSAAFPQDAATLSLVAQEIDNSIQASKYFMGKISERSRELKRQIRTQGGTIQVDVLCLGAGVQCAEVSLVLGRSKFNTMVVEATNLVANNFASKSFFINSEERAALTMHEFPGGVGELSDHTSQKYASSVQLAAHIQEQQYASDVPVLLGSKVAKVEIRDVGKPNQSLRITTANGITIIAKHLFVGTGLGTIGTKVRDEGYRAAFDRDLQKHLSDSDKLFPVMSTDTFLEAIHNARLNGKTLTLPQSVVIVGDGDGARIAMEGMRNPNVNLPAGFQITNIGNNFQTAADYLASRKGSDRYRHLIVPFYAAGQVHGNPGHVQSWSCCDAEGRMQLVSTDKETGASYTSSGQMVIDSTGYDAVVPGLQHQVGAADQLADFTGPLPEMGMSQTILMRQMTLPNGTTLPIYAIGAAAGPMATREELTPSPNRNPISIFNTVARTSMAVAILFNQAPFSSQRGARTARKPTISFQKMIEQAEDKRNSQQRARDGRGAAAGLRTHAHAA